MSEDAQNLYAAVFDLAPIRDPARALKLGDEAWPAMRARPPSAHDAETCRLLFVSAAALGMRERMWRWRERALYRFAQIGWGEGVAAVEMANALSILSVQNNDYPHGATLDVIEGSEVALRVLDLIRPFAADRAPDPRFAISDRAPNPRLVARWYWENRGLLLLLLRRLDEATESYATARSVAADERGALKVDMGAALVRWLRGDTAAIDDLARLRDAAETAGDSDLAEIAGHNLAAMRAGRADLRPFAIL